MSPVNERDFVSQDAELLRSHLERLGPVATFPWHTQQEWALRAATDTVQINGGNQCVVAGTRVLTMRGLIPAEEVRVGDVIPGPKGARQEVVSVYVSPSPVPVYRVRTKRGYEIVTNAEHPLLAADAREPGWHGGVAADEESASFRRVSDLAPGQYLRLAMRGQNGRQSDWAAEALHGVTPEDAYFLGVMTGDGWWHHETGRMSLIAHREDDSLIQRIERYLRSRGIASAREERERSITLRWCSIEFKRELCRWGVSLCTGESKAVPECIWRSTEENARQFLRGLFDADGCGTTKPSAVLVTTSETLARGVHILLGRWTITASLRRESRPRSNFAHAAPRYRLEISGSSAARFALDVGFGLARKQARLPRASRKSRGARWDRIVSVEPAGEAVVYGFTCPPRHVFYANGIVNHNSGKSISGIGVVSRLVRREGPIYARLATPEKRTLLIWVAPKTLEKYRSIWEPRILDTVFQGMAEGKDFTYRQNPFPEWTWYEWRDGERVEGGKIVGKAQKQGFMAFESDAVDLIVLDEEPDDPRILTSCKARFSTTNGVMVLCFTPLLGMSFTYHQNYAPVVKPENQIGDRVWQLGTTITVIEMGMADNPASVAGGGVKRLQDDPSMSPAEKNARLYGKYGYTEGLLFPMWAMVGMEGGPDLYLLDELPKNRPYAWTLTADPNKRHGALLTALDSEGNRYFCSEHFAADLPDSRHAEAYKLDMLAPWGLNVFDVQVYVDPGGAGAQAMLNLAEYGIMGAAIRKDPGSVAASIKRLRGAAYIDPKHRHPVTGRFGAPRVYFIRWNAQTERGLRSVWTINNVVYAESRLMWELRQYRQEEESAPDTPVKALDDVVDCARYFELARAMEPRVYVEDERLKARAHLDDASRSEAKAYDELCDKADRQYRNLVASAGQRFIADRQSVLNPRR